MKHTWLPASLALIMVASVSADDSAQLSSPVCSAGLTGEHPAGRDQDRDGVPDSEDWCTGTPTGSRVNPDGCLDGQIEVSCFRSASVPVRAAASAITGDSDNDGVPDSTDRCPGTARGVPVDAQGCVVIEKVVLKGVNFASGSATLRPAAHDTLRSVAAAMKVNTRLRVEVGGHTDSIGAAERNQTLSERRADAVKDFLVKEGVAADRLGIKGYGSSKPADTNDTPQGRANNRRVEFRLIGS